MALRQAPSVLARAEWCACSQGGTAGYVTYIPLNGLQQGAVAALSAIGALADPSRADLVAALGETTGQAALRSMRSRMRASSSGREILQEQPRVTNASVAHAWDMPPGTFGHAYAQFMGSRSFQADDRPPVRFIADPELAFIAARAREVHDFWHVLFGCHTNVFGELALKMVEAVQTGMPMAVLSVLGGQMRLGSETRSQLISQYLPWALRAGSRSADLMCLYYEKALQEDLELLRQRWRIEVAPKQLKRPPKIVHPHT